MTVFFGAILELAAKSFGSYQKLINNDSLIIRNYGKTVRLYYNKNIRPLYIVTPG